MEGTVVLFGREPELRLLDAAADEAAAGRGSAILIEGEPGIGKSALLDALAARCARLGMRVLRATAEELEQELPFATAGACLDVLVTGGEAGRARVAALLRGEDAGRQRGAASHDFVVTEAMLDLVDEWCAVGPVAVLVDDVQWADPQSTVVLHRLCRGIEQYPLLVAVAAPPGPHGEAMGALVRSMAAKGARRLPLRRLPPEAVSELVEAALGAPAGPHLTSLIDTAEGHPLYVSELVAGLTREGAVRTDGGRAETADDAPPASLRETIMSRLDPLPAETRTTLCRAAALGSSVDPSLLAAVLDIPALELAESLSAATATGLLTEHGGGLHFRHDLICQVLARQTPPPVHQALHLRAAQVLMARADVERIAEHLTAAGGADCTDWLLQAAPQLTVRAPQHAVALLRAAIGAADPATGPALQRHLARALLWAGAGGEAEQLLHDELAADPDPAARAELLAMLMDAHFRQGRLAEAAAAGDDAARLPTAHPGRLHGFAAACRLLLGQLDAAEHSATLALRAGRPTGDAVAQVYGHNTLAALRFTQDRVPEALALNADAVALFDQAADTVMLDPLIVRALCLFALERPAELDAALDAAARRNRDTGGIYLTTAQLLRANVLFLRGRWDDALAEIRTGLDSPDPLRQAPALHGLAAMIGIHRGEVRTLDPDLSALAASSPLEARFITPLRWAYALAKETRAGPDAALDAAYPLWERPLVFNPRCLGYRLCADLARLAYAAGDTARLRALARSTAALLVEQPTDSVAATVDLCRGLLEDDPAPLLAAAESFARAGWPMHEGYAREHAAVLLARHGRPQPARDELARALALYTGLDAGHDIARARAHARQAGIRQGVRGPRQRPKHGWAALSQTEHKVALEVAAGRSNPEIAAQMFLSPRTVQSHVSSILAKLGVRSRVEIAVSATAEPLAGS